MKNPSSLRRVAERFRTVGLLGLLLVAGACADSGDDPPANTPAAGSSAGSSRAGGAPESVEAPADPAPADVPGEGATTFERVLSHYEVARRALTADVLDGVAESGRAIEAEIASLEGAWSVERAGVTVDGAESVEALLAEVRAAAASMAVASDLESARDGFYDLSKPLVRWRKAATGDLPQVAYCSMAERSWLQTDGKLENPYYGHSMLHCGEVVDG